MKAHAIETGMLETDSIITPAETKVAAGYALGLIGKEIADKCGISRNTVVRHTQNIYDKAGIPRSTNALAAWFLEKNYHLDLSEVRRRIGAVLLLGIFAVQTVCTDFGTMAVRTSRTRTETRTGSARRKDESSTTTLNL